MFRTLRQRIRPSSDRLRVEPLEDRRLLAAGDLDPSFGGGDGLVSTDFNQRYDEAFSVAMQADGKIVVAGRTSKGFGCCDAKTGDYALARYHPDGTLDTSFDGDGQVQTALHTGKTDHAFSVTVQADGKIVAAGTSGGDDFGIIRYNANGSLDTSFDKDGKLTTNFGGSDTAFAVALDPSGTGNKLIVAGKSGGQIVLARYLSDGKLDTSFSGDGKVFSGLNAQSKVAMAVDASGIYVRYHANDAANIAKFNFSGALDASFGVGGIATSPAGTGGPGNVLIDPNGRIITSGSAGSDGTITPQYLVRFNANGTLDSSFDADGVAMYPNLDNALLGFLGAALQSDGKIVAFGDFAAHNWNLLAVRFNSDGSLDTSYGTNGRAFADFGMTTFSNAGVMQSDGSLIVVGRTDGGGWPASERNFAIARFLGDPPAASASTQSSAETDAALLFLFSEDLTPTSRRRK